MRRRWAVRVVSAALVVAVLAFDAIVVGTALLERRGLTAWEAAEPRRAGAWFARVDRVDLWEPWIAPFDRGTASLAAGRAEEALAPLERALDLAPETQVCRVALNLALARETVGDLEEARAVLLAHSCRDVSSPAGGQEASDGRPLARSVRPVLARLERALAAEAAEAAEDPAEPEESEESADRAELERRNDRAERAREEQLRREQQEREREQARERDDGQAPTYAW